MFAYNSNEVVCVIESKVRALDALNDVLSDLGGAADVLSLRATVEGDDMAGMLARVLDDNTSALREVAEWLEHLDQ